MSDNTITTHEKGVRSRNNNLYLDFYYKGLKIKEFLDKPPTVNNVKAAVILLKDVKDAIRLKVFSYDKFFGKHNKLSTDLSDFADHWVSAAILNAGTEKSYRSSIRVLVKAFPKTDLQDLTPMKIQLWIKASTLAPKTIRNHLGVFSAIFNSAKGEGLLSVNPVEKVSLPLKKDYAEVINPFSKAEMAQLLYLMESQEPELRNMVEFAVETGLRISEYTILRYKDIDVEKRQVHVCRALDAPKKGDPTQYFKLPKNNRKRFVSLTLDAVEAVERTKAYYNGNPKPDDYVFQNSRAKGLHNQCWDSSHLNSGTWRVMLKRCGIEYRNLYQLRHTFGSQLVSSGRALKYVSQQMGHSSVVITEQHYSRFMQEAVDEILAQRDAEAAKEKKKKLYLVA
jgi:integrase